MKDAVIILGDLRTYKVEIDSKNNELGQVCSDYDGNTLFFDDEIIAWTELPEPQEGK